MGERATVKLCQKEWSRLAVESGDIRNVRVIHPIFAHREYMIPELTVQMCVLAVLNCPKTSPYKLFSSETQPQVL